MEGFLDRRDAGQQLAEKCQAYAQKNNTIVLALPRGGVPVAYEVAKALSLPLDVFVVRKLGMPGFEELALGAIASNNTTVFNEDLLNQYEISQDEIDQIIEKEQRELERRQSIYRGERPPLNLNHQTVILVDDGIATGATVRAAIKALRWLRPEKLILAVPVIASSSFIRMEPLVDEIIYVLKPIYFNAVGEWYAQFNQTSDEEVCALMNDPSLNSIKKKTKEENPK